MYLKTKLNRFDGLSIVVLLLLIAIYAINYIDFSSHPFEDAAMVMRYAQHLAEGHGIVWNVGEKPVDGATDFIFMILSALFVKAGMPIESSVRLISFVSHILTVIFVYVTIRKLRIGGKWLAFISAAYLAIGPGLRYVEFYFGVPLFALFVCITWWIANELLKKTESHVTSLIFVLSCLIMGLIKECHILCHARKSGLKKHIQDFISGLAI